MGAMEALARTILMEKFISSYCRKKLSGLRKIPFTLSTQNIKILIGSLVSEAASVKTQSKKWRITCVTKLCDKRSLATNLSRNFVVRKTVSRENWNFLTC